MKITTKKFESLGALSAFIASTPANGFFEPSINQFSNNSSKKFAGTENFDEANNLMLHGWSDGAARVQSYMTSGAVASASKRQLYNSVVGFTPNVPNYLSGHPLNMINQRRVKTPKRVVTIIYNCSVGYGVNSSDIEKVAARLFNIISGLEKSGVRVELWAANLSTSDHKLDNRVAIAVKIKSAGQPFNLLKMIYPIVHPSFNRRHIFAVKERIALGDEWENYGRCASDPKIIKSLCDALRLPADNVFNFYDLEHKNESEIAKMVK